MKSTNLWDTQYKQDTRDNVDNKIKQPKSFVIRWVKINLKHV